MKFLAMQQEKGKKIKSVFDSSRYLLTPQARRSNELTFCVSNLDLGL
jgi:hypothetical protein